MLNNISPPILCVLAIFIGMPIGSMIAYHKAIDNSIESKLTDMSNMYYVGLENGSDITMDCLRKYYPEETVDSNNAFKCILIAKENKKQQIKKIYLELLNGKE